METAAAASPSEEERNKSVLEKLILRCGPDSSVPAVIAFDMCVAGIDTTGNTIAFALGLLARNQRAQVCWNWIFYCEAKICQKSPSIGCVIPRCNL